MQPTKFRLIRALTCYVLGDKNEMSETGSQLEQIKFLREEIKFEHKQIADRLSPFVTAQSFVTTAFAVSAQNADHSYSRFVWYAYKIVVPFGFFSAILVLCAIGVGVYRLHKLRKMLFDKSNETVRSRILPSSSPLAHYISLIYAFGLPLLAIGIWIVVYLHGTHLAGYEAGLNKSKESIPAISQSGATIKSSSSEVTNVPQPSLPTDKSHELNASESPPSENAINSQDSK